MREVTVFVGGSIGSDPYSPRTWSGSSVHLLKAMAKAELLHAAVGIHLPKLSHYATLAKNFNTNRSVWRKHFYFDPSYRRALTEAAARIPVESPVLMQIGHMFSLPKAFPTHKCISYHDGNLAEMISSGFGIDGVSNMRIEQALEYEHEAARSMTAVFTFSEYLRQSFIHAYGVPENRVFNVGGGINLDDPPAPDPAKTYTAPRILFIGTEFLRKGGQQLLEAFRIVREQIPAAELHIAGPTHVDNLPAGATLHGHLSKSDPTQKQKLEQLFRSASIFTLPSLYEPFGIAPLEAMLYQLPCVLTNDWALKEFVTPGVNGELVAKDSIEDLAEKITMLLSQPDRLATMGRNARETVLNRYTWPAVAGRMAEIISTL
ncbi:glycosyltransferase family 4 protein [Edaphobacter flagellatus]|uniref:glycosyltransferase family 4 protein n=1 Tax=Edaphobacter flagellatus TaxID=1933044 RepID=UPI0021B161BA|nr:glycosyltransferase family 4 protein [Edaphobacter flagellatus]